MKVLRSPDLSQPSARIVVRRWAGTVTVKVRGDEQPYVDVSLAPPGARSGFTFRSQGAQLDIIARRKRWGRPPDGELTVWVPSSWPGGEAIPLEVHRGTRNHGRHERTGQ